MTQEEFNVVFELQMRKCADILAHKKKEYTGDNIDRLSAFKIAAALQNCDPKAALAGMMSKHVVSLYDMCYSRILIQKPAIRVSSANTTSSPIIPVKSSLIHSSITYWNFPYTFHLMYIQPISHDIAVPLLHEVCRNTIIIKFNAFIRIPILHHIS